MTTPTRSTAAAAQQRFDRAGRGLGLRLDGRPAHVVDPGVVQIWLEQAQAAAADLDAALAAGDRAAAVPQQVARQRLAGWLLAQERGVLAQNAASAEDRALATALTTGRLILHRYSRHFGGQHRATRDLGRLAEARQALVALTRKAQLLSGEDRDPILRQEARALPRFIEFLVQEQGEISDNLAASGRLDQAQALGAIAATLEDGWRAEVVPVHRLTRRLPLLDRYLQSIGEVHDRMNAVRHANLPQAHEDAIVTVQSWQAAWQDERDQTHAEHLRAGPQGRRAALLTYAEGLWLEVQDEVQEGCLDDRLESAGQAAGQAEGAVAARLEQLRTRCDRLDEVWTQLREMAVDSDSNSDSTAETTAVGPDLSDLRDALIWLGQRYDQLAAPA